MRKFLSGVLAASMLFGSSTVFADDKAGDIRKQILELTKELTEVSQTEGGITYNLIETSDNCDYIIGTATNNYDYVISIQPYVVARDENGNIILATDATSYSAVNPGETVTFETYANKDISNAICEFGSSIKPSTRTPVGDKIKPIVTDSNGKIRVEFELDQSIDEDDLIDISVYVLYYKDGKVVDIQYEWGAEPDDVVTIKYDGDEIYDNYEVYLNSSCW